MKEREITALELGLGYHFRRRAVIEQAVTHSSQAREQEAQSAGESKYKVRDNEQLEFLGDAVLALVTSEELFQRFPNFVKANFPSCEHIWSANGILSR